MAVTILHRCCHGPIHAMYIPNETVGVAEKEIPVLYDVDDIQRIFGIGRTKAYQLMDSSGFPSFRLNRRVLVSREKLEEWIRKTSGKTYVY